MRKDGATWWLAIAMAAAVSASGCGEKPPPPPPEEPPLGVQPAAGDLAPAAVANYLSRHELDTPEIRKDVTAALRAGQTYRKRVRDRRDRWTLATVSLDRRNILVVTTMRDETCPDCRGTGTRETPFQQLEKVQVDFRCLRCKGEGTLERHVVEKKYILNPDDYADPARARRFIRDQSLAGSPPETAEWLARLGSDNPRDRLAACNWLDRNYVREGAFFQDLQPMLGKARQRESNDRTMVWQFWAGRGDAKLRDRAYYRVYVDARTGKVTRKGFFPEP